MHPVSTVPSSPKKHAPDISDVCCSRYLYLNLSCNPDSTPRSPYFSPEIYLGLLASPVVLIILFGRNLHLPHPPPPPPVEREQLPDGAPDQIPTVAVEEDADKAGVAAADDDDSSSVPSPAKPYRSGNSCHDGDDNEACRWVEGAVARRFRYPPVRYLELAGDGDHLFDPDSMGMVPGPSYAASADGSVDRSDEVAGILNKMASALRGILLDTNSSDESTVHPANGVFIHALQDVCTNTETVQLVLATIEPFSQMFQFWLSKLEDDAEMICQGEAGRRNIFLLNNMYYVWQMMRRPGASFSNIEVVSMLISVIQRYRRSYFDVCWVPLNNQHRLYRFTAEFLVVCSQQMAWKVTAELRYNLRQEIVDFIVPPYEASLLAMQAKRSRVLAVLFLVKRVMTGKKKQKKYTGDDIANVITELFEG